ncbi:MAG: CheY-like chemotaxis protein [Limisphaerales bacterium]|jgi:CheY-like chemotaxis protein
MAEVHKILVLDDDPDFRELCTELLETMHSNPEINSASSGTHAIAMLKSQPYSLLVTDLQMPNMDGFQVLSIVKKRFPNLRTIVMTGMAEEDFRSRAYAIGIDLYIEKPRTPSEIKLFVDCVESLLHREEATGGFRGVQSKSLADIVQMESMSQSSLVLKITNGPLIGCIWLLNGDLVDSEVGETTGEEAFKQIMSWRSGTFETLPGDRNRQRRILNSVQGLLLDSAQSLDEIQAGEVAGSGGVSSAEGSAMARLVKYPGVEFALETHTSKKRQVEHFACEDPELVAKWGRETTARFSNMGELLGAGRLEHVVVSSSQRNASLAFSQDRILCLGTDPKLKPAAVLELTRKVEVQWAS